MSEKVFGNVKREPVFKPVLTQNERKDDGKHVPEPVSPGPVPTEPKEIPDGDLRDVVAAMEKYLDVVHQELTDVRQAMEAVIQVVDQHGVQIGEMSQDLTMTSGEIVRISRYLGRQIKACETAINNVPSYVQYEVTRQIEGGQSEDVPEPVTPGVDNQDTE